MHPDFYRIGPNYMCCTLMNNNYNVYHVKSSKYFYDYQNKDVEQIICLLEVVAHKIL